MTAIDVVPTRNSNEVFLLASHRYDVRFFFQFWKADHFVTNTMCIYQLFDSESERAIFSKLQFEDMHEYEFNEAKNSKLFSFRKSVARKLPDLDITGLRFWDYERHLESFILWTYEDNSFYGRLCDYQAVCNLDRFGPYVREPNLRKKIEMAIDVRGTELFKLAIEDESKHSRSWWD